MGSPGGGRADGSWRWPGPARGPVGQRQRAVGRHDPRRGPRRRLVRADERPAHRAGAARAHRRSGGEGRGGRPVVPCGLGRRHRRGCGPRRRRRRRARRASRHPIYGRGPRGRRRRGAGVVHQRHDGPAEADLHQPRGGVPAPEVLRLGRRPGRPAGDRHDVGPDLPHRRHAGAADQLACRPQAGGPAPLRCRVVAARRRGAPGVPDVRRTHDAPAHPGPSRLPVAGPQLPATAQLRRGGCAGRPGGTSPRRPAARRVRERLRPDGDPRGVRRPHGRGPPRPPQAGLGGQGAAGRRAADRRPRGRRGPCCRSGRRGVGPRRAERQPRLAAHG